MTTFVLVHGAWHGGWCYARTAKLLRAQGHDVFTPTLTGVGERSHLNAINVNLSLHIQDIVNVFRWEDLTDVVLCGHSYGGMVITGVADALADRIRSLVYLDAFVPEDGQALWSFVADTNQAFFLAGTAKNAGVRMDAIPGEAFNVNAKDLAWVNGKCVPMGIGCFLEPVKLGGAYRRVAKRTYIYASGWSPSPFTAFYEKLKGDAAWKTEVSPAGHDVMVDDPKGLADMLIAAS